MSIMLRLLGRSSLGLRGNAPGSGSLNDWISRNPILEAQKEAPQTSQSMQCWGFVLECNCPFAQFHRSSCNQGVYRCDTLTWPSNVLLTEIGDFWSNRRSDVVGRPCLLRDLHVGLPKKARAFDEAQQRPALSSPCLRSFSVPLLNSQFCQLFCTETIRRRVSDGRNTFSRLTNSLTLWYIKRHATAKTLSAPNSCFNRFSSSKDLRVFWTLFSLTTSLTITVLIKYESQCLLSTDSVWK